MQTLNCLPLTVGKAHNIIKQCILNKQAVLLHGKPGIGKTEIIESVVEELGEDYQLLNLRLAQFPSEDLAGLPVPVETKDKNNNLKYKTLRSLPDFLPKPNTKGVLFLDEINQADTSVLHAIFQLIWDRKLEGAKYKLPKGWAIVAACNDYSDNPEITEFSRPLNNRFLHLNIQASSKDWLSWAKNSGVHKNVVDFVKAYPAIIDSPVDVVDDMAFCSPRSLKRVSDFEFIFDDGNLSLEDLNCVVTGLIGSAVGESYLNFTFTTRSVFKGLDFKKYLLGKQEYNFKDVDTTNINKVTVSKAFFDILASISVKKLEETDCIERYLIAMHKLDIPVETIFQNMNDIWNDGVAGIKRDWPELYKVLTDYWPSLAAI